MSLENLFKYKHPIKFLQYIGDIPINESQGPCDFVYYFGSDKIHNSISKPKDIYEKLKPFFMYLISKIKYEVQFPYRIVLNVHLYVCYKYYRMVHFVMNENFEHDGVLILQGVSNHIFKQPFKLDVCAHCYCPPGLRVREGIFSEDEEDEEEEEVPTLPLQDHFKTDQCIICMEKEPCILFTPCRHICVCVSCDALKPSYKCSCCRTRISQKIKI